MRDMYKYKNQMSSEKLYKSSRQHEQKIKPMAMNKSKGNPIKFGYVRIMDMVQSPFIQIYDIRYIT
jgi:hypothetical protein